MSKEKHSIRLSTDFGELSTRLENIGISTNIEKSTDEIIGAFLNNNPDDKLCEYFSIFISAINEALDISSGKKHLSFEMIDVCLSDTDLIGDCPRYIDS